MGTLVLNIATGKVKDSIMYECIYINLPLLGCMSSEDIKDEVKSYLKSKIRVRCYSTLTKDAIPYDGRNITIAFLNGGGMLFMKDIFVDRDELLYYIENKRFSDRQLSIFINKHIKYKWAVMGSRTLKGSYMYA